MDKKHLILSLLLVLPFLGLEMSPLSGSWIVSILIWVIFCVLLVWYNRKTIMQYKLQSLIAHRTPSDVFIGETSLERRVLRSLYLNGYCISNNPKTDASETFSFRAIPPFGHGFQSILMPFNISQLKSLPNILRIHGGVEINQATQQELGRLPEKQRKQVISEIGRDLTLMSGIEFSGVSDPLTRIDIEKKAILSKTGEDSFYVEELLAFSKAVNAVIIALNLRLHSNLPNLQ